MDNKITKMIESTPNDMELGKKVREYYWHTLSMGTHSHREEELDKEYLEHWTCEHCGKNTHEVDYDYLGNGTNHLQCELELGI
tara:strand:- start:579 stop:827 length:249 start_codon:yes stop_codon:yes gene_type:complete